MARKANWSKQTQAVLAVFFNVPAGGVHGYELSARTGLKSGTLYPILMRLKAQGFLLSEWQPSEKPGRPPRQMYQLSASGQALAVEQADARTKAETAQTQDRSPRPKTARQKKTPA